MTEETKNSSTGGPDNIGMFILGGVGCGLFAYGVVFPLATLMNIGPIIGQLIFLLPPGVLVWLLLFGRKKLLTKTDAMYCYSVME